MRPAEKAYYKGKKVKLICYSILRPSWTKGGYPVPSANIDSTGKRIKIIAVSESQGGRYTCTGTKQGGEIFTAFADVYVGGKFHSGNYPFLSNHCQN